ncbi:ABC transporter substrate-binding protein [Dactylosporangium maewongense]|uniref:ABC transporter substrate-binding protein n=1 Tax=Dactylosporangium maewongense TaxID=634393 RepID=A0ABP4PEA0_9ACTN
MKLNNRLLAAIVAIGVGTSMVACSSSARQPGGGAANECRDEVSSGVTKEIITLGTTLPLSGSAASTSQNARKGEEAAIQFLNKQGGLHGRRIEMKFLDDQYLPAKAQANVRQLIQQDNVFMLVGGSGTGTTLAWAPTLNQFNVPAVGPYAGSSNLGTMKTPYLYMLFPDYGAQLAALVKYAIAHSDVKKIGVVSIQGDILEDARRGIDSVLAASDIAVEYFPETAGTTNFAPLATSVKAFGADLVVLLMTNGDTAGFLNATRRLGFSPRYAAWPGMADKSWIASYGDISEGMLVANPVANPGSDSPAVAEFRKHYMELTGEAPTLFNEIGWVQVMVAAKAIEKATYVTRPCVIDALNALSGYETGLVPPITFGKEDRQGSTAIEVDQITGGSLVTVEPFANPAK